MLRAWNRYSPGGVLYVGLHKTGAVYTRTGKVHVYSRGKLLIGSYVYTTGQCMDKFHTCTHTHARTHVIVYTGWIDEIVWTYMSPLASFP